MTQTVTKAEIVRAVEELPDNATLEDAIDRLVFLHKVQVGLQQARAGEGLSLDEAEARLDQRRTARTE